MEITKQTRPIEYDLNYSEAKQWYESGNETLRNLAIGRFPELEKPQLPKSWEELKKTQFIFQKYTNFDLADEDWFCLTEQNNSINAFKKLSYLREVYRQGWVPDWEDTNNLKYSIVKDRNYIKCNSCYYHIKFLTFQDRETAEQFISNFKDLIEQASPLLFG